MRIATLNLVLWLVILQGHLWACAIDDESPIVIMHASDNGAYVFVDDTDNIRALHAELSFVIDVEMSNGAWPRGTDAFGVAGSSATGPYTIVRAIDLVPIPEERQGRAMRRVHGETVPAVPQSPYRGFGFRMNFGTWYLAQPLGFRKAIVVAGQSYFCPHLAWQQPDRECQTVPDAIRSGDLVCGAFHGDTPFNIHPQECINRRLVPLMAFKGVNSKAGIKQPYNDVQK